MYTILIADPDLYAVGVFGTKEEANACIERMKLPVDSLVIEMKVNLNKQRGTEVPTKFKDEKLLERLINSKG